MDGDVAGAHRRADQAWDDEIAAGGHHRGAVEPDRRADVDPGVGPVVATGLLADMPELRRVDGKPRCTARPGEDGGKLTNVGPGPHGISGEEVWRQPAPPLAFPKARRAPGRGWEAGQIMC